VAAKPKGPGTLYSRL